MEITGIKPIVPSFDPLTTSVDGTPVPVEQPPVQPQSQENVMEQEAAQQKEDVKDPEKQREKLSEAVDKLNKTAIIFDRSLKFTLHDKTKEFSIAVVDTKTDKVIREIPPKELLDLVSKMKDYLGMIFDKKA
jgi:flagellar protein FlaG